MWSICKKELRQFFSSLIGILAIMLFLILNGLFLFVFPDTNLFDEGFATMDVFFQLAPLILLLLIPAITMRSLSEEFKTGTYEILRTKPLTIHQIILGKYISSLIIMILAVLPTISFVWIIDYLSSSGIDTGGIAGSYIGLICLGSVFISIGIWCSSFTTNAVIAFMVSVFVCFVSYYAFEAVSRIPGLQGGADYYIEVFGIDHHYRSMSRGVIDLRDLVYFFSVICFFIFLTARNLVRR
ncbi:MAG: gliding motility-associated transporter permease subunit GldF [Bacteroidota bacterium]|jgi:ABC-2 type transport system permease protein